MDADATFRYCERYEDLFSSQLVDTFGLEPGKVFLVLDSTATVESALEQLSSWRVLSAPVRDVTTGKCAGFVDMLDLVHHFIRVVAQDGDLSAVPVDVLPAKSAQFYQQQIGTLIDFSKRNPFVPCMSGQTLWELLVKLDRQATLSIHRFPIVDGVNIINIITQSSIVRFLARYITTLGPLGTVQAGRVLNNPRGVVSVRVHEKAADAFLKIYTTGVSAVAVVDEKGRLVSVISASDLVGLTQAKFHRLLLPVTEYIKCRFRDSKKPMTPPVTCGMDTNMENVILKVAATKVHRIFVVGSNSEAQGVISLTDVLATLVRPPGEPMSVEPVVWVPAGAAASLPPPTAASFRLAIQ